MVAICHYGRACLQVTGESAALQVSAAAPTFPRCSTGRYEKGRSFCTRTELDRRSGLVSQIARAEGVLSSKRRTMY